MKKISVYVGLLFIAFLLVMIGQYIAAKLQLPTAEHGAQYLATAITLIF